MGRRLCGSTTFRWGGALGFGVVLRRVSVWRIFTFRDLSVNGSFLALLVLDDIGRFWLAAFDLCRIASRVLGHNHTAHHLEASISNLLSRPLDASPWEHPFALGPAMVAWVGGGLGVHRL